MDLIAIRALWKYMDLANWLPSPNPPVHRLKRRRNPMRPSRYVVLKLADLVIASAYVAVAAYLGWTFAPPAVKQTIQVIVTMDTDELTQTIKNLQAWAAIEVERARSGG